MTAFLQAVFGVSAGFLGYVYLGYPLAVRALGLVHTRERVLGGPLPTVALVISAYNEEGIIRRKLENALALEYPRDRLQIWVSSDGSTDEMNEIVAGVAQEQSSITLVAYPENRGKTAALMDTIAGLDPGVEVVAFSDANSMYSPSALRALVGHFADVRVGAVAGAVTYAEAGSEGLYRRYENWIKRWESAQGSCLCAEGSIFAARRSLIRPVDPTHVEDLAIPLAIALDGYDVVFEPAATSFEEFRLDLTGQYRRRRRIINRAIRTVASYPDIFRPWRSGANSLMFISHRVLRWASPLAFVAVVASVALLLLLHLSPQLMLWGAAIAVGATSAAALFSRRSVHRALTVLVGVFVANAAVIAGLASVVRGRRTITWTPDR